MIADLSSEMIKFVKSGPVLDEIVKLSFFHTKLTKQIIEMVFSNIRSKALDYYTNFGLVNPAYILGIV